MACKPPDGSEEIIQVGHPGEATEFEMSRTVSSDRDRRPLSWPGQSRFYLTLDLECDYGTATTENTYEAAQHVDSLVEILERTGVPLTCFVQTELLEELPTAVEQLRTADVPVTFHPHSHSHRRRELCDIETEISTSTERFREFFGDAPTGYRFPDGHVEQADYPTLAAHGYEFDASVFPSWRPGRFNNAGAHRTPTYRPASGLIELPFTVYPKVLPVPTALSYCQLLGRGYVSAVVHSEPSTVVFNVHMHDLVRPEGYSRLPWQYRLGYSRSGGGFDTLETILDRFDQRDYQFGLLDEVNETLRAETSLGGGSSGRSFAPSE